MKRCLAAVSARIKELKKLRSEAARQEQLTYQIDYELRCLQFGAWVLHHSIDDLRCGREPWLNGYHQEFAHGRGSLFVG